jgi:hypothetical protein
MASLINDGLLNYEKDLKTKPNSKKSYNKIVVESESVEVQVEPEEKSEVKVDATTPQMTFDLSTAVEEILAREASNQPQLGVGSWELGVVIGVLAFPNLVFPQRLYPVKEKKKTPKRRKGEPATSLEKVITFPVTLLRLTFLFL